MIDGFMVELSEINCCTYGLQAKLVLQELVKQVPRDALDPRGRLVQQEELVLKETLVLLDELEQLEQQVREQRIHLDTERVPVI